MKDIRVFINQQSQIFRFIKTVRITLKLVILIISESSELQPTYQSYKPVDQK